MKDSADGTSRLNIGHDSTRVHSTRTVTFFLRKILPYLGRRALFIGPQIFGVLLLVFVFVRLIPGDPARLMAGPFVNDAALGRLRESWGLSDPLHIQFSIYVKNIFQGDLGSSWYTGNPVLTDIMIRLPATAELIILALLASFIFLLPIGLKSVSPGGGAGKKIAGKGLFAYGMAAGAFPDFWLALLLILIFYAVLGWAPPPTGQLDIAMSAPTRITGMYLVDSLITGNWIVFKASLSHLILPVFTLTFVYGGGILKIGIVESEKIQRSKFINFAKVSGLPLSQIQRYITRAVQPSVATMTAVTFGFLIGGAVLVETVFSWGGLGQYAVQSVINSDYAAVQGVVLVLAVINLFIYIVVDILYFLIDPRIKNLG